MSGPYVSPNGDVVSSVLSVGGRRDDARDDVSQNFRIEQGQVVEIYTVDSPGNDPTGSPGKVTLYDVKITRDFGGASAIIRGCRLLQPSFGGGLNNFLEVVQTDPGPQAQDNTVARELKRGHMVAVAYLGGNIQSPVIIGSLPHSNPVAVKRRPTQDKGVYLEGEVQGLNWSVDNEGAFQLRFNGPRKDDGSLANQNGPTQVQIDAQGNMTISTNNKQKIEIDRTTKIIQVTNGPTYIKMDQDADKIKVVAHIIEHGVGDLQPHLVGNDWKKMMENLIDEIIAIVVPTGVGPSGTPVNRERFLQIRSKLKECLSRNHVVEK